MFDYIDGDVGYLLGLLYGRGEFSESGGSRTLRITFDFKSLEAEGLTKKYDQLDQLKISLADSRERLNELLEVNLRQSDTDTSVTLYANFTKNTISWRNLRLITENKSSYREFKIIQSILDQPVDILTEIIRGLADSCGFIRTSNIHYNYHRVFFQITNHNWKLPIQICHILQQKLKIPVQTITWGHPNIREPGKIKVKPTSTSWAREHQIKVFANDFQKCGFGFKYKNEILNELAEYNIALGKGNTKFCFPKSKLRKRKTRRRKHPCENHKLLPEELRGKHFSNFRKICYALGCRQKELNKENTTHELYDEDAEIIE